MGFPLSMIPIVLTLGLVALLGTTPGLFRGPIANAHTGQHWVSGLQSGVVRLLTQWQDVISSREAGQISTIVLPASLVCVLALVLASVIRALRSQRAEPFLLTVFSLAAGLLAIPAITWATELGVLLYRIATAAKRAVTSFFHMIAPGLAIAGLVILAIACLAGLIGVLMFVTGEGYWAHLLSIMAICGLFWLAARLGWLRPVRQFFAVIGMYFSRYVGQYLIDMIEWAVIGIVFAAIFLVVFGVVIAVLGQLGRTVLLSVISAPHAGKARGRCADLAAGVGVTASVVLCGAALDATPSHGAPPFQEVFASAWSTTSELRWLPVPTDAYSFLLPTAAKHVMAPAFVAYDPLFDCLLLLLTASLGTLSMLFASRAWVVEENSKIFVPVMIATGIAVAAVLPLLAVWMLLRARADSG